MTKQQKQILMIGGILIAGVITYRLYNKYKDDKKVAELKQTELSAASAPTTATPGILPTQQTFVQQPQMEFISQPEFNA